MEFMGICELRNPMQGFLGVCLFFWIFKGVFDKNRLRMNALK